MRHLLPVLFFFLFLLSSSHAQQPFPCGTIGGKSEWLKKYQAAPELYRKDLDTLLYVPLTIHLVGTDEGAGYFKMYQLLDALCRLNLDFEESNIQFFIEGEINYLPNSAWYVHETVIDGAYMMFENNVPNTINCYFVSDPAGNCGYNLPYAGIAMDKSCSGPGDHTWAHEIGHALSIQHPFLGWEGGVSYDNSIPHNFNDPAPTEVYYDYTLFKDTLWLDTLIIDTALVELVDGSNCHLAADGFCDTSPDYLALGWFCNASGESQIQQTDPTGATFRSDGSLIMGYAADNCQARFTPEQIGAMRANLFDEKPELLYNQTPGTILPDQPLALLLPEENDIIFPNEAYFQWDALPGASQYVLQVSRLPNFVPTVTEEYVVSESFAFVYGLQPDKTYYWRVRPFNAHHFCAPATDYRRFETGPEATDTEDLLSSGSVRMFPNPVSAAQPELTLVLKEGQAPHIESLQLYNLQGQPLASLAFETAPDTGSIRLQLPPNLPSGIYLLSWRNDKAVGFARLLVN